MRDNAGVSVSVRRRTSIECWIWRRSAQSIEILLLLRVLDGYPPFWQAVTGGVEADETPLDAAAREVEEEAGLSIHRMDLCDLEIQLVVPMDDLVVDKHLFAAQASSSAVRLSVEHADYRWVSFGEAARMLHWHSNRLTLAMVARRLGWNPDGIEITGAGALRSWDSSFDDRLRERLMRGGAVVEMEPIGSGEGRNLLYRYRANGTKRVAKLYCDERAWRVERDGLVRASRACVPVPTIVDTDSFAHVELYLTVMTDLGGEGLQNRQGDVDNADLLKIWRAAGASLLSLHRSTSRSEFGPLWPASLQHDTASAWMTENLRGHLRASHATLTEAQRVLADRALEKWNSTCYVLDDLDHSVLIQGDFGARNLVVTQRGGAWQLAGIVDFEHARWAFPLLEFAKLLDREWSDPTVRAAFEEGYGPLPPPCRDRRHLELIRIAAAMAIFYHTALFPDDEFRSTAVSMLAQAVS